MTDGATIQRLIPEIILVLGGSAIILASAFQVSAAALRIAGRAVILAAVLFLVGPGTQAVLTNGVIVFADPLSLALRWITLISAAIFVHGGSRSDRQEKVEGERIGLTLFVFAGCMLVGAAADLSLLFVAMELVSIPTYTLLFLGRRDAASSEASIKYFLLSIFSSAFFLYGLAWVYLLTGTTSLVSTGSANWILEHGWDGMWPWAVLFVFCGLGFKLAAFPMQFYAPDVYQGATPMNAGLLAVAPKIVGVAALLRLLACWGPEFNPAMVAVFTIVPIVTMSVGNVGALWQSHLRRLLAYSSIAHAGYLLIGVSVLVAGAGRSGWVDGAASTLLYLAVYAIASLGTFCALAGLRSRGQVPESLDELAGLARREPWMAFALSVFMFSMAGIPPLAGFWGKLGLLTGAVRVAQSTGSSLQVSNWMLTLAVVGVLNAAVAAAYYLRVIGTIWFRTPVIDDVPRGETVPRQVAVLCAVLLLAIGIYPQGLISGFRGAATASFVPAITDVRGVPLPALNLAEQSLVTRLPELSASH